MKHGKLKQSLQDIYNIPPNDLYYRPVTRVYKLLTGRLKKMPFLYIVPLSFFVAAGLYLIFGQLVIKLVSLLQYGS
jgi:hypothetical protein